MCGICYADSPDMPVVSMVDRARMATDQIMDEYANPYSVHNNIYLKHRIDRMNVLSSFQDAIEKREFVVYYPRFLLCKAHGGAALCRIVRQPFVKKHGGSKGTTVLWFKRV